MRFTLLRRFSAVAIAGAALSLSGAPAAAGLAADSTSYLRVHVSCFGMLCEASARGGSGSYAGWEWGLAEETWVGGNASGADASTHCVSGLMLGVAATVTDSNGTSASGSASVFCP